MKMGLLIVEIWPGILKIFNNYISARKREVLSQQELATGS